MAAVVAHEVKNPIAGIRGALQVIGSRMTAEARDKPIISEIIARLDALNRIVQDLLVFARPRELRAEPTDVKALLTTTIEHLKRDPAIAGVAIDVSRRRGRRQSGRRAAAARHSERADERRTGDELAGADPDQHPASGRRVDHCDGGSPGRACPTT